MLDHIPKKNEKIKQKFTPVVNIQLCSTQSLIQTLQLYNPSSSNIKTTTSFYNFLYHSVHLSYAVVMHIPLSQIVSNGAVLTEISANYYAYPHKHMTMWKNQ